MDNAEEILHFLEVFSKQKSKSIPPELNDYLSYVARTGGDPVFQWGLVKDLFKEKLLCVLSDFYENSPSIEIPSYPNVDPFDYDSMKNSILERLDSFLSAPFTLQRICELLIEPRKQYNRIDKYMRAIEKNILVVSTREPGSRFKEQDNGEPADAPHNGSDNISDYNVDVEMEEDTWKESRSNKYMAPDDYDKKSTEESPDNQVAQYECVTPPDDSTNDPQESDSAEEDKADDSSNSYVENLPKTPEADNPKDEEEKQIAIPKIVISEDMNDEKDTPKEVSEIVSSGDEVANIIIQIPNDDVQPQDSPIESDDVSPSDEKVDEGNKGEKEDVSHKDEEASSPKDEKVTHKVFDEAIVEKCDVQAESISDPQIETKSENHAAIEIIEKVPDELSAIECSVDDNEASPKLPSIKNLGDDFPKTESADSAITALAKDGKDLVKNDLHIENAAEVSELAPDSSTF